MIKSHILKQNSIDSMAISDTLEMLNYQNQFPNRRSSRNAEAIRSQVNRSFVSDVKQPRKHKSQKTLTNWSSATKQVKLYSQYKTEDEDKYLGSEEMECFDPDFIL